MSDKVKFDATPAEQMALFERGVVDIHTRDSLEAKVKRACETGVPLRVKLGLDPTAPDVHLGHTVVLRKLRQFQDMGHKAILIIGDYTALVGDPSGKSKTRPVLSPDEIDANVQTYLDQVGKVLDVDSLEINKNSDWFASMGFRDVLALAATGTVAQMLARDDFRGRFEKESAIGVHELLYPLMQGRDSVEIDADVEIGGTDQTFNLLVGRDMQKAAGDEPQVAMTLPLLVGLDGIEKMSKSLGNYIGVDESPKEIFGKVMSVADTMMANYFTLLTGVPESEFKPLVESDPRAAKERLGVAIVDEYCGAGSGEAAAAEFRLVFSQKQVPDDMPAMQWGDIPKDDSGATTTTTMMVVAAGHAKSNSEARRLIEQGAFRIDDVQHRDPSEKLELPPGTIIRTGKRRWLKIE